MLNFQNVVVLRGMKMLLSRLLFFAIALKEKVTVHSHIRSLVIRALRKDRVTIYDGIIMTIAAVKRT